MPFRLSLSVFLEEPTPDPQSARDNEVLSAALLCLRSRPWEELLIDLHMAYVEVRLDALAAHHDHKRKPTQVSPIELLALQKALDFDTARSCCYYLNEPVIFLSFSLSISLRRVFL